MAELWLKKILGGPANGQDVPSDWETIATWERAGTQSYVYEERSYRVGKNLYHVWVPFNVADSEIQAVIDWHAETFRQNSLADQKELLQKMMESAAQYTQVVMVVAYAALIAFLTTFRQEFTAATAFAAAVTLSVSLLAFIGWEVFGMVMRGISAIRIAQAVENPWQHAEKMDRYRADMARFAVKFRAAWILAMGLAVAAALTSFAIMGSAMLHGSYLELASGGTCERATGK